MFEITRRSLWFLGHIAGKLAGGGGSRSRSSASSFGRVKVFAAAARKVSSLIYDQCKPALRHTEVERPLRHTTLIDFEIECVRKFSRNTIR